MLGRAAPPLPQGASLEPNYPNPFNGATVLRYLLPAAGHVRLEVYDLQGQRVKSLGSGRRPAGPHQAAWDGTDEQGAHVASGVYVGRLETAQGSQTRKLLVVR